MTRDNLLTIAKKFQLSTSWQAKMSGTETIDFIRSRTQIKPSELQLQGQRKDAIAFTVGFEYEQPQIAMKVANELVTMILNEDVRSRTASATETSQFLEKDVNRLETQLGLIDAQVSQLKQSLVGVQLDSPQDLAALRAELVVKSATYSDSHPDIQALKRKIKLLEKSSASKNENPTVSPESPTVKGLGIDSLETKRSTLKDELNKAFQKLAAARLGESLERGQHSERLEVIEQPTLPQKPISPNRPKLMAFVFILAAMAGGGLVFAGETLNQSVYRSTDLFSLVDRQLVVSIPYISTQRELARKRNVIVVISAVFSVLLIIALIALWFFLPPLDVLFTKTIAMLFG